MKRITPILVIRQETGDFPEGVETGMNRNQLTVLEFAEGVSSGLASQIAGSVDIHILFVGFDDGEGLHRLTGKLHIFRREEFGRGIVALNRVLDFVNGGLAHTINIVITSPFV